MKITLFSLIYDKIDIREVVMLIDVLVNIKTFGEKVFTYKSNEKVLIGSRVEVPLMKRSII